MNILVVSQTSKLRSAAEKSWRNGGGVGVKNGGVSDAILGLKIFKVPCTILMIAIAIDRKICRQ